MTLNLDCFALLASQNSFFSRGGAEFAEASRYALATIRLKALGAAANSPSVYRGSTAEPGGSYMRSAYPSHRMAHPMMQR